MPEEEGRPIVIARSYTLESQVLKQTRRINVYVPWGYTEGQARLPVLSLLDGGEKEDLHHITGIAQLASLNHAMRELIVVGIEGIPCTASCTAPCSTRPRSARSARCSPRRKLRPRRSCPAHAG